MKLYEHLSEEVEVPKLVSLANDLRAAGKKGQLQGKFTDALFILVVCFITGTDHTSNFTFHI